jgi:hypothetical protein
MCSRNISEYLNPKSGSNICMYINTCTKWPSMKNWSFCILVVIGMNEKIVVSLSKPGEQLTF